jgi:hypothetical protein
MGHSRALSCSPFTHCLIDCLAPYVLSVCPFGLEVLRSSRRTPSSSSRSHRLPGSAGAPIHPYCLICRCYRREGRLGGGPTHAAQPRKMDVGASRRRAASGNPGARRQPLLQQACTGAARSDALRLHSRTDYDRPPTPRPGTRPAAMSQQGCLGNTSASPRDSAIANVAEHLDTATGRAGGSSAFVAAGFDELATRDGGQTCSGGRRQQECKN